ncbi:hypothetical protein D9756_008890 [Leucocoprinus leucothites]|uniref:Small ribosomal subunit protein uS7 domain-containing protein n=1 Tax=Leucocoprinus leucothites TaxID=201217 RepID=A0A8H5FUM0_9AGAR|nr:hypothetical protein D9756_008890 [Leucoagaricus leucothites]
MLSSLRSTVTRSLPLHARAYSLPPNRQAIEDVFSTFGLDKSPIGGGGMNAILETFQQPPERKPIPLDKIEVPLPQDPLLHFFTSQLMHGGKRARAEKCTSEILLHLNALTKAPPMPILREAVLLAAPAVKVLRHKSSSKVVVKPFALSERQRAKKAIVWILEESNKRVGYTRGERIARECIAILQGTSQVLKNKEDEHKLAMVNRGNLPRVR